MFKRIRTLFRPVEMLEKYVLHANDGFTILCNAMLQLLDDHLIFTSFWFIFDVVSSQACARGNVILNMLKNYWSLMVKIPPKH